MTLPTNFWLIVPGSNGVEYSAYAAGNPPIATFSAVPDFLNRTTALSVNVLTTYLTPTTGLTCVLNGVLPAGWAFNGTTLTYDGTTVDANPVHGLTFTATNTASGWTTVSNTFSVQGTPAAPVWTATVPNFLAESTSVSVNILSTYVTPFPGCTCVVNGTLPAGWDFDGTTLTYDGVTVNGSLTAGLTFTATNISNSQSATSNAFSVQGIGSITADTTAPTVPVGLVVSNVTQTPPSVTLTGFPSSDPVVSGRVRSGMEQYTFKRNGSVIGSVVAGSPDNAPAWQFTDISTPSPASTVVQTGADLAFTTVATDPNFPLTDGLGFAYQVLTGTSWVLSCKIASFVSSNAFNNFRLTARQSLVPNAAYVAVVARAFAQGGGLSSEYRAAIGGGVTNIASVPNSTGPVWLVMQRTNDTYTLYCSFDGNTLTPLGTRTQAMGSTLYVGGGPNSNNGSQVQVTAGDMNLQTAPLWQFIDTTVTDGASFVYQASAQDNAGNSSAYGNTVNATVPALAATSLVKLNTGHYGYSFNIDGTGPGNNSEMTLVKNAGANVKGYMAVYSHAGLESTLNTYNFAATIVADFNAYQTTNPGSRFAAGILDRIFPSNLTTSTTISGKGIPAYILANPGAYGAGPNGTQGGYCLENPQGGGIYLAKGMAVWRTAVMARRIALFQALANYSFVTTAGPYAGQTFTFNTHPLFEAIYDANESILSQPIPGDYSNAAYIAQLILFYQQVAPFWPNTSKITCINWGSTGGSSSDMLTLINAGYLAGWDFSGPDVYGTGTNPSATGGTPHLYPDAEQYYVGNKIAAGAWTTSGATDYRPLMAASLNVQQPDYSHGGAAAILSSCLTMQARRIFWGMQTVAAGLGDWKLDVVPVINGTPNLNATAPANYFGSFDRYISPTGLSTNLGTLASPWDINSINTKRATYAGKKLGIIGDQGSYANCYTACGSPNLNGRYTFALLQVAEGSPTSPTLVQSCTSLGAPAGPHIAGTTAAQLNGGLTDANNGGSNTGSALIGHNGTVGYVTIRGLEITGCNSFGIGMGSWGTQKPPGLIAEFNYVHGMLTNLGTGNNPTAITFRGSGGRWIGLADSYIANNFITDCRDTSAGRFSAAEVWQSAGVSIKYNTIIATAGSGDLSGGAFCKNVGGYANRIYGNHIDLSLGSASSNGVTALDADNSGPAPPYSFYFQQNTLICPNGYAGCYFALAGVSASASGEKQNFINNTIVNAGTGWYRNGLPNTFTSINNIHHQISGGGHGAILITKDAPAKIDCNCYPLTVAFDSIPPGTNGSSGGVSSATLAAWRIALAANAPGCVGKEAASIQHVPTFKATGTYAVRWQLQPGDLCLTSGRIDGTIATAVTQQGAWGGLDIDTGLAPTQVGASWKQI